MVLLADAPPVGAWKWKGVGAGRGVCAGGGRLWAVVKNAPTRRFRSHEQIGDIRSPSPNK